MVDFKLTIGDPKSKRTYKAELKSPDADQLLGKKIGTTFRGELLNLPGYEFQITGGSDKAGFPMHPSIESSGKARLLLSKGPGYKPLKKFKGRKERKLVRGSIISSDIVQVNCKVVKWGEKDLAEHFGVTEKKAAESAEAKQ